MPRQFTYRGHSVDELKQMSMDEFIKLLPSRQRRSLLKGLTNEQRILMEHVRQSRKDNGGKPAPVKSHVRDMIVIPEMLGLTLKLTRPWFPFMSKWKFHRFLLGGLQVCVGSRRLQPRLFIFARIGYYNGNDRSRLRASARRPPRESR